MTNKATKKSRPSGPAKDNSDVKKEFLTSSLYTPKMFSASFFLFLLTKCIFRNIVKKEKPRLDVGVRTQLIRAHQYPYHMSSRKFLATKEIILGQI